MGNYQKVGNGGGWKDYPDKTTKINAANLNHMDEGILAAHTELNEVKSSLANVSDAIEELQGHAYDGAVDLTSYTTTSNGYTTQHDGYVYVNVTTAAANAVAVQIYDSKQGLHMVAALTVRNQMIDSVYVKKGMYIVVASNSGSNLIQFRSLKP